MRKSIIFLFFLVTILSCKKEPTSWDLDALVPLLKTKMTLQQAIPDSLVNVDSDNKLNLVYKGSLLEFNLDSVFAIPDTTMEDDFFLPIGSVTLIPGQTFLADTLVSNYDMKGAQITEMKIGSGIFHVYVSSTLAGPLILDYAIPSATKNGQMFFVRETIPAGTISNPTYVSKDYDISGYDVNLSGDQNNGFNIISTQYRVYVDSAGSSLTINAGDKLIMGNTLENILPSYARGYFGIQKMSETAQNEALDAFKNIISGSIDLDEVKMEFNIKNELGVDIGVNISELIGKNSWNNTDVSLMGPIINQNLNLNRSTETGKEDNPIQASVYSTTLNPSNSNVTEFISNLPDILSYQMDIDINPLGNVSNSNDFVYDSTGIEISLDAEIPFKLSANNLVLIDSSEISIDSNAQEEVRKIIGGFVKVYADNWYPFSLGSQFYMLDENFVVIDSLFTEPQLISSGIPIGGEVLEPTSSILQAPITGSKIDNLYRTKYIESKLRINTHSQDKIQVYGNYFIDISVVGDFQYLISIN